MHITVNGVNLSVANVAENELMMDKLLQLL
jgi:hypothetical protein